jgi:hypothetical protein
MSISTVVSITTAFIKFTGEVLAELKGQDLTQIDVALLNLKRSSLAEELEDCKAKIEATVVQAKSQAWQDLINRGLANTTVRDSQFRTIDQDAANELYTATREHNRAIEEIALLEQQVKVRSKGFLRRIFGGQRSSSRK